MQKFIHKVLFFQWKIHRSHQPILHRNVTYLHHFSRPQHSLRSFPQPTLPKRTRCRFLRPVFYTMRLQVLALSVLALVFPFLSQLSYAISPNWLVRVQAATLENTCQCDCCYPVGFRSRTECIPPIDTSFDVPLCSKCHVDTCAAKFPIACAQLSSIVSSDCITRKGWMLRLVPILFIAVSACLLCYGFFFKKFDGYHDDRGQVAAPVLRDAINHPYNTFPQGSPQTVRSIGPASEKSGARSSSQLAPILETEELPATPSPQSGVSATETTSPRVSQPSLGEIRIDTT